jgi:hypothetical protein
MLPRRAGNYSSSPYPRHYNYVNIWVDHHSHYIFPTFHETKELREAHLSSKDAFGAFAACHQVRVESILVDKGVYASRGFQADCEKKGQKLTFGAVGGYRQNGLIKHYIGHIMETAHTILLHVISKWPGTITKEYWSFAVWHACTFVQTLESPLFTCFPGPRLHGI